MPTAQPRSAARPIYHGWVMMFALAMTELVSWGVTYYAFSVMLTPMRQELGWTPAQFTGAFSLALLISGFSDMAMGHWLDRHGPRLLMTVGSILAVLLVLAWSQVHTLAGFYAIWIGIGLVGPAIQYGPAFWAAARWFNRRRGLALTVLTFGGGLASTVFIPLTNALTIQFGWRAALQILAGIIAVLTILPHALLLRRWPSDLGLAVDGQPGANPASAPPPLRPALAEYTARDVLATRSFWLFALGFALSGLAFNGMAVHLISLEIARGQDASFVAWAAGLTGVLQVVGRITLAPLSDRLPRRAITLALFGFQTVGFLCLIALPMRTGLLAFVIFRGIGNGTLTPIRAALLADVYGTQRYGSINGLMSFVVSFASAVAPVAVGVFAGAAGYMPVLWVFAATSVLGALAIWFAR